MRSIVILAFKSTLSDRNCFSALWYIYDAGEMSDLFGTYWRYLSLERLQYVIRSTYYRENICKFLSQDESMSDSFSLRFIVSDHFFPLTIEPFHLGPLRHSLPFAFAVLHWPHDTASDIQYIRGSLCFMANCFIIFDIFPVWPRLGVLLHGCLLCVMNVVLCTILNTPTCAQRVFYPRNTRIERDKQHFLKKKSILSSRVVKKIHFIYFMV